MFSSDSLQTGSLETAFIQVSSDDLQTESKEIIQESKEIIRFRRIFKQELANGDPFIEAIFDPDLATLEALLKKNNTGDYYGTGDRDGELLHISDALYWGCHFGYAKAVKLMLEKGVVPLKYPPHICAEGPIVIGACYGGLEVLQTVTESVLVKHPNYVRSFLNARDRITNSSALHVAAKFRDTDMVIYLLSKGTDPCLKDQDDKYPYQYAEDRSYIYDILRTEQMHCALRDRMRKSKKKKKENIQQHEEPTLPARGSSSPPVSQV
ncbi:hypothetical protein OROHE_008578 [Orobanche hederae]